MTRLQVSVVANVILAIAVVVLGIQTIRGGLPTDGIYGSELGGVGHMTDALVYYHRYVMTHSTTDLPMAANQLASAGGDLTAFGELTNSQSTEALGNVVSQLGADLSQPRVAPSVMKQVAAILHDLPQTIPAGGISMATFNADAMQALNHVPPN